MNRILVSLALLCFSYACFATPTTTHHHTSHKAAAAQHPKKSPTPAVHTTKIKPKTGSKHVTKHHHKAKSSHPHHASPAAKPAALTDESPAEQTPDTSESTTEVPPQRADASPKPVSFLSWFGGGPSNTDDEGEHLINNVPQDRTKFAQKTVATLHYSAYKFGGNRFDARRGIYMLDCSGYVDNILHQSSPKAYSILARSSGSYKPNSEHYYNFFNRLSVARNDAYRWNKVENPQQLRPGDILVFRYKNAYGRSSGGHVMLVMNKPEGNSEVLRVRVADSASKGHSADTRGSWASGIGIGTLLLKVNPSTAHAYAYAWSLNSPWNSRVSIAMGRPPSA